MDTVSALIRRLRDEEAGFSLIELLVVTILIGILAAIALAAFLGEQDKARDSSAKSNVAAVVSFVEACWADSDSIRSCDEPTEYKPDGVPVAASSGPPPNDCVSDGLDPPAGEVAVVGSGQTCYVVKATSESEDGGTSHVFWARRRSDGSRERECTPTGIGGCPSDGTW